MKLKREVNTPILSNANPLERKTFKIGNEAKILEMLRKRMYAHPIRTMLQEYISNARDACRKD
jgi:HSP90 family molecular chaperone